MSEDRWSSLGAAAGAMAVIFFIVGSLVIGTQPDFNAPASEIATHLHEKRTRIQIACALYAAVAPLLIWFLATARSEVRDTRPGAQRAAAVAYGCGLVYVTMFLADTTALAVSALRPENMAADPELSAALRDFEWLAIGMASFVGAGALAAFAVLILRDKVIWPAWLGWLAAFAAAIYTLRVGVLFTTNGPFAADGLLGLYVPVAAFGSWIVLASLTLTVRIHRNGQIR